MGPFVVDSLLCLGTLSCCMNQTSSSFSCRADGLAFDSRMSCHCKTSPNQHVSTSVLDSCYCIRLLVFTKCGAVHYGQTAPNRDLSKSQKFCCRLWTFTFTLILFFFSHCCTFNHCPVALLVRQMVSSLILEYFGPQRSSWSTEWLPGLFGLVWPKGLLHYSCSLFRSNFINPNHDVMFFL